MSISSSFLPLEVSLRCSELYGQSSSNKDFLSRLENEPALLTELFERAIKDNPWIENNQPLFADLAATIRTFEKCKRFNAEQLHKIGTLCREVLLYSSCDRKIKNTLLIIHQPVLTFKAAIDVLLYGKVESDNSLWQQCFTFIQDKTGQQIGFLDNGVLEFKISTPEEGVDHFLECITSLDEETKKRIDVHLAPSEEMVKNALSNFCDKYGKYATSLSLKQNIENDRHLGCLIDKCLNIKRLCINSSKIKSMGNLSQLPNLTTLVCQECSSLFSIPILPHLTTLDCKWCSSLLFIPKLPSLITLDCSECDSLQAISELPNLTTLYCLCCKHLPSIPMLRKLTTLECIKCRFIRAIPELPSLQKLSCSDCSSLQAIPMLPNLKMLDCSYCESLRVISELPSLTTLDCKECRELMAIPDLPSMTSLNCRACSSLQTIPMLPNLTMLDCCSCEDLQAITGGPNLTTLRCADCDSLQAIPMLPSLTSLRCWDCSSLQEIPTLPNLKMLDCSSCDSLKVISELPSLTALDCEGCLELMAIPDLPSLTKLDCAGCNFSFMSRIIFLFSILLVDEQRCLKFCQPLHIKQSLFGKFFIEYFNAKEEVNILQEREVKQIAKGNLRKQVFRDFPFLLSFLADDITVEREETSLPASLRTAIDEGNVWKGLSDYYGINPKKLQKIPLSHNSNLPTPSILRMLKAGILKPEWLPCAHRNVPMEQKAFCDVMGGCIILTEKLGFEFKTYHPDTYHEFLIGLIQSTVKASSKNWQRTAAALPAELQTYGGNNVRDAIDDFIKTVFLPYRIQSDLESYKPGNAHKLLEELRLEMIARFLKGVSVGAICELSSLWHEPRRAAQLNKAKTFSDNDWEPLFFPSFSYEYQRRTVTAVSLTASSELKKEGTDLSHCVGGYTYECLKRKSHIISLRDETGKSLSTLELRLRPGKGKEGNPRIINIKGNVEHHLKLKQHHGEKNQTPPPLCKEIEGRLFEDMREGRIAIDLSRLEKNRKERKQILKEQKDIVLIGYDPTNKEKFSEAKTIYRRYGIGNIPCENTLRANFDRLTGEK